MKKYIEITLIGLICSINLQAMEQNNKEREFGMSIESRLRNEHVVLVSPRFHTFQPQVLGLSEICEQAVNRAKRDKINPIVARRIFANALLNHIVLIEFRLQPGNPGYNEARITCQTNYGQPIDDLVDQYFPL